MPRRPSEIVIQHRGLTVVVRRNDGHPEGHLWIDCDGKTFFLGVLTKGMTRGDVKALAREWLEKKRGA